jgi:hypothetical protein
MHKKLVILMATLCVFVFAGAALAGPPNFNAKWVIMYDGYLQELPTGAVLADTFIVVNNPKASNMGVWIEVYDKYGELVAAGTFYDGGNPLSNNVLPGGDYGWITLGMLVPRATADPWGMPGAEKFSFKVFTAPSTTVPVVEVKQVIYNTEEDSPGEAFWQGLGNIKTWSETCLGGNQAPGVVYP